MTHTTVNVNGTVYLVAAEDDLSATPLAQSELNRHGFVAMLALRRPNGRRGYWAYRRADGSLTRPEAL